MKLKVWMGAAFATLLICTGSFALPAADTNDTMQVITHNAAADPIDPFVSKQDNEYNETDLDVPIIPFVTVTDPIDPI